jgi:hypothetical protein
MRIIITKLNDTECRVEVSDRDGMKTRVIALTPALLKKLAAWKILAAGEAAGE